MSEPLSGARLHSGSLGASEVGDTARPFEMLDPDPAERQLIALLEARIRQTPARALFSDRNATLTAEDFLARGRHAAQVLVDRGLQRGERIAVLCGNRREVIDLLVACSLLGIVMIPINTASKGTQLAYYLNNSRARLLITEPPRLSHLESAHQSDPQKLPFLESILVVEMDDRTPAAIGSIALKSFKPADTPLPITQQTACSDLAVVMYTSGTSGPSKGVMCSQAQLYWWGHYSMKNIGVNSDDVLYTCLPLFHINALSTFYQALISGARMHLGERFSVSRLYDELIETQATVTYLLGAMVPMLLSRGTDGKERQHRVRVALAPGVPEKYHREFEAATGITVLDGFGSTETNFVICSRLDRPKPGWMGIEVDGFQARVVDDNDNEVSIGMPGELLLRQSEPYAFSSGYFEMPEKTAEAWKNLWFHTGDRVLRDEHGYFRFLDRIKDSVRRRGENISSQEVEQVIATLEAVEGVAVYAVPSELAEDEVMCTISLRPGTVLDPLDVIRWCEPRLSHFAIPRFVRFSSDVPLTENGKVQKYKLRALGVTSDTWDLAVSGYKVNR